MIVALLFGTLAAMAQRGHGAGGAGFSPEVCWAMDEVPLGTTYL